MIILDLFCGAGGASMGYKLAGFDIIGVDISPQPHYPFEFKQMDALTIPNSITQNVDAIHASPPCQAFSKLNVLWPDKEYPNLIEQVRTLLQVSGVPYIIENVPKAPLINPITLCGSMFEGLEVRRHRAFECSFPVPQLECNHARIPYAVPVYGHTGAGANRNRERERGRSNSISDWRRAMGIEWMTTNEITQAIPPAYTKYIGRYLMEAIVEVEKTEDPVW
jgi:DNA (cytosine-5)-methyltransferase 1